MAVVVELPLLVAVVAVAESLALLLAVAEQSALSSTPCASRSLQ